MVISAAIPSSYSPADAAAFRKQILVALEQGESIAVNADTVGTLPAAWAQLLVAAAKSAARCGRHVVLRRPSEACLASFATLGIDLANGPLRVE